MEIQINNYAELLEFIKRENINSKQATEIVCKALNVWSEEIPKDELIKETEFFINKYCGKNMRLPLFLTNPLDK